MPYLKGETIEVMFVLKGIIIGMIVSFPVGPLGLLSVQRTVKRGRKIGFLSGVGAALSDLIYSSIAVLGMGYINHFIKRNISVINWVVGILFLSVGTNIFIKAIKNKNKKIKSQQNEEIKEEIIHPAVSNFLMGLSNPMTFLVFVAIFTRMHIHINQKHIIKNLIFVSSIFAGSCILWLFVTGFIKNSEESYKIEDFRWVDRVIGTVIILFGIFSIVKGIRI